MRHLNSRASGELPNVAWLKLTDILANDGYAADAFYVFVSLGGRTSIIPIRKTRSNEILQNLLTRATAPSGSPAYVGKIMGAIGLNMYKLHNVPAARHFTAKALDECKSVGDADGIRIYSFNLEFIDSNTT